MIEDRMVETLDEALVERDMERAITLMCGVVVRSLAEVMGQVSATTARGIVDSWMPVMVTFCTVKGCVRHGDGSQIVSCIEHDARRMSAAPSPR